MLTSGNSVQFGYSETWTWYTEMFFRLQILHNSVIGLHSRVVEFSPSNARCNTRPGSNPSSWENKCDIYCAFVWYVIYLFSCFHRQHSCKQLKQHELVISFICFPYIFNVMGGQYNKCQLNLSKLLGCHFWLLPHVNFRKLIHFIRCTLNMLNVYFSRYIFINSIKLTCGNNQKVLLSPSSLSCFYSSYHGWNSCKTYHTKAQYMSHLFSQFAGFEPGRVLCLALEGENSTTLLWSPMEV